MPSTDLLKVADDPPVDATEAKRRAALVYARTSNGKAASSVSGIKAGTIRRWARDDAEFQELVKVYGRQATSEALVSIQQSAPLAAKVLRRELRSPSPNMARVRTARACLDIFFRAVEMLDLSIRIKDLEQSANRGVIEVETL